MQTETNNLVGGNVTGFTPLIRPFLRNLCVDN